MIPRSFIGITINTKFQYNAILFNDFVIRGGNGWEQTTTNECISQGKRHVVSAGGHNFAGEILSAGRDGNFSVSRRDGTVMVRCHGGTGR